METESLVRGFIAEELLHARSETSPEPNDSLISTGLLDSLALLKLLLFLEKRFGVKVHDGEVVPSNFETVNRIVKFVELKTQSSDNADTSGHS